MRCLLTWMNHRYFCERNSRAKRQYVNTLGVPSLRLVTQMLGCERKLEFYDLRDASYESWRRTHNHTYYFLTVAMCSSETCSQRLADFPASNLEIVCACKHLRWTILLLRRIRVEGMVMEEADDGLRRPWSGKQLEGLLKSLSRYKFLYLCGGVFGAFVVWSRMSKRELSA